MSAASERKGPHSLVFNTSIKKINIMQKFVELWVYSLKMSL